MPTPWQHPKYGTYYLKKRVPTDIKHLWLESDPVQISLGTKDTTEAHTRICREWLKLQSRFDKLRRLAARQVGLSDDLNLRPCVFPSVAGHTIPALFWRQDVIYCHCLSARYGYSIPSSSSCVISTSRLSVSNTKKDGSNERESTRTPCGKEESALRTGSS